ncbi:GNAT family N-acetyltransferase [Amycolatopsis jiangsuensis]|uniref:Putative GNAT superfamily acetyltransferase n=1 Tax=Amycolatopsis jiangsuensis TaxID=1181879 RepID=A0A840IKM6_9PSEU|nr:GNAT family N-acetyltransferase [Amycolatopsis jiangsuensis]MBB4682881.1 putative GNAT superfamily acetyltransferase [Amycolatopsis jiangsuensis]
MTDLVRDASVRDEAEAAAAAAASASGVAIRELSDLADLTAVCRLLDSIWRPAPDSRPVTTELLRAMSSAGNYVSGAYDGDALLGACFGFFGPPSKGLHSHIAGVAPEGLGRGLGFALKQHQRAWALRQDVTRISWTFDPLVRRNAHFNLSKLGARAAAYLPDFYGPMHDSINGATPTDRLLIAWDLTSASARAAALGDPPHEDAAALRRHGAEAALSAGADGGPVTGPAGAPTVLVAVPSDIEALRRTDPPLALSWRSALGEVLSGLLADGAVVTGFDRAGWYVLTKKE